jgi:hypothetical protein
MDPLEPLEATKYLQSLLNRQLRIHTTDTRVFVGEFKCTDSVCNPFPPLLDFVMLHPLYLRELA